MDWGVIITILSTVAGVVGGWGVHAVLNPKAAAAKPELENKDMAIDTLNKVIETMKSSVESCKESEEYYRKKYEEGQVRNEELQKETVTKSFLLCIHAGCEYRKPTRGQGDTWYEEHKADPSLGCDYLPLNRIMEMYKNGEPTPAEA